MKRFRSVLNLPSGSTAEWRVMAIRECPAAAMIIDQPSLAVRYWHDHIATGVHHNQEVEQLYVLVLNTRKRIKGHYLVATGTLDTVFMHPREVFRGAIVGAASAILIMHNHPSGDPSPSEADIRVTRDLIRGGQLLKIEVCDHIIVGQALPGAGIHKGWCSLRELGYFYTS